MQTSPSMIEGASVLPCYSRRPKDRRVTAEGYPCILFGLVLTVFSGLVFSAWAMPFPFLFTLYGVSFFRNPRRAIPQEAGLVVSPADGTVLEVADCEENRYLKARAKRISIFMSPFNCHINRAPVAGKVLDCFYQPGTFTAAYKPKAMERNEHHAMLMEDSAGKRWLVVQIAGWLARRIVSYVNNGDRLEKGERFGLIQFGSRADLYCPTDCEIVVQPGQKVYAGKTVLGRRGS